MPTLNLRFTIYIVLAACMIGLIMRYDYLAETVKTQDAEITQYKSNAEQAAKQIKASEEARTDYLQQLEASKNEINSLRDSVTAGTAGLRVKASCHKSAAPTDSTRTEIATAELDTDARQDYFALREAIGTVEARYRLCVKTLEDDRKNADGSL